MTNPLETGLQVENMKRRYLAEFIGTFGIVFAPVALSASGRMTGGDSTLAGSAWASGLAVLGMIYALGHISAAHFNPAVTLGFASAGRFPWRYVFPYIIAQFAGGIVAAFIVVALFGSGRAYGVHVPAASLSPFAAVGVETVLTFLLMLVIIAVATDKRAHGAIPGIAIGLTVVFDVLIGGPATGGSMNPARSLGPALAALPTTIAPVAHWWIYAAGPVLGALLGAQTYEAVRGNPEYGVNAPSGI